MAKMINALPEWIVGPEKRTTTLQDILNIKQDCDPEPQPRSDLPRVVSLREPCVMMGYQYGDQIAMQHRYLHLWDKLSLEPYAHEKHVSYMVVAPKIDNESHISLFFSELGAMYQLYNLGNHKPASVGNTRTPQRRDGIVFVDTPEKTETNTATIINKLKKAVSNTGKTIRSWASPLSNHTVVLYLVWPLGWTGREGLALFDVMAELYKGLGDKTEISNTITTQPIPLDWILSDTLDSRLVQAMAFSVFARSRRSCLDPFTQTLREVFEPPVVLQTEHHIILSTGLGQQSKTIL
mmetsp:Transcript_12652/g.14076  ORF Transcript_12652/g.14076 Transcript_12652/m.14076 type:complete len:294 (+) Transcript_12652:305-1186(+)